MRRGINPRTNNKCGNARHRLLSGFLAFLKLNNIPYTKEGIRYMVRIPCEVINKNAVISNVPFTAFFSGQYGDYDLDTYFDNTTQQSIKELQDEDISKYRGLYSLSPVYFVKKYSLDNFDFEAQKKLCYITLTPMKDVGYYRFHITPYIIYYMYQKPTFVSEISDKNFIYSKEKKWQKRHKKKSQKKF